MNSKRLALVLALTFAFSAWQFNAARVGASALEGRKFSATPTTREMANVDAAGCEWIWWPIGDNDYRVVRMSDGHQFLSHGEPRTDTLIRTQSQDGSPYINDVWRRNHG